MINFAFDDLLPEIYAAALEPMQWGGLLGKIGGLFDASSSFLFTSHSQTDPDALTLVHNIDPVMIDAFRADWSREDVWALSAARLGLMKRNTVVLGPDLISRAELHRTRFFNDFARHFQLESILGTVLFDGHEGLGIPFTNLCWYRAPGRCDFERGDQAKLRKLVPHLQQSLRVQHRLQNLAAAQMLSEQANCAAAIASFLLDESGRVIHANSVGEDLLSGNSLLRIVAGRIRGFSTRSVPTFDDALKKCLLGSHVSVLIQGKSHELSLLRATLTSMPPDRMTTLGLFEQRRALLMIDLPRGPGDELLSRVGSFFGLTPAERLVVRGLMEGLTVDEISDSQEVTISTVRTHVRSLLSKTGLTRQTDLVRTLAKL